MKIVKIILLLIAIGLTEVYGQTTDLKLKTRKFKTSTGVKIEGQVGYLKVPENRSNPESRTIEVKFVRLKSLAANPKEPIIYLEGGGKPATWQVDSPKDLNDWLPILQISDLIFYDQRGTTDQKLIHVWQGEFPTDFFVSEAIAQQHYEAMTKQALTAFETKGVDVAGYTVVEHAKDIQAIAQALDIPHYSLFGFSFGSHIGMSMMKLDPSPIVNAVLISADAPDQSFNYPVHLDDHFKKVSEMAAIDPAISKIVPDLQELLSRVMAQLEKKPAELTVKHPLTGKDITLNIGSFGLSLVLRLDIDDANDIPIIPRLLYSIDQGDYSLLQWFLQKRVAHAIGLPGNGINQALASGASTQRWTEIQQQAAVSQFGNVVNVPFSFAREVWPTPQLEIDTTTPLTTNIRTLFVTGTLDARTPVIQVNKTIKGFSNATHLTVKNAGHEQAMWDIEVFDEAIPAFLLGKDVSSMKPVYRNIKFIPLTGSSDKHPALKK